MVGDLAARIETEHLISDNLGNFWRVTCPNCELVRLEEENQVLREFRRSVLARIERIEFTVGEIAVADPF